MVSVRHESSFVPILNQLEQKISQFGIECLDEYDKGTSECWCSKSKEKEKIFNHTLEELGIFIQEQLKKMQGINKSYSPELQQRFRPIFAKIRGEIFETHAVAKQTMMLSVKKTRNIQLVTAGVVDSFQSILKNNYKDLVQLDNESCKEEVGLMRYLLKFPPILDKEKSDFTNLKKVNEEIESLTGQFYNAQVNLKQTGDDLANFSKLRVSNDEELERLQKISTDLSVMHALEVSSIVNKKSFAEFDAVEELRQVSKENFSEIDQRVNELRELSENGEDKIRQTIASLKDKINQLEIAHRQANNKISLFENGSKSYSRKIKREQYFNLQMSQMQPGDVIALRTKLNSGHHPMLASTFDKLRYTYEEFDDVPDDGITGLKERIDFLHSELRKFLYNECNEVNIPGQVLSDTLSTQLSYF